MNKVYWGDCRDSMRQMIDEGVKVQMCVTSPPYYGLRDYGHEGQMGQEKTAIDYIANMVEAFGLVKELLNDDGVLWLNLGDSYGKGKQLLMIPARVALALQNYGWILRQDVIWNKPNPMPESVTDRCTRAHEYLFMFSKSERYYYDNESIKEPATYYGISGMDESGYKDAKKYNGKHSDKQRGHSRRHAGFNERWDAMTLAEQCGGMRNKRSVWTVATKPYSGAHFATFPQELIEPCILAGSRANDIVLDPFFGSGTTGEVCQKLGRRWVGCELNPAYGELQKERTAQMGMAI